MSDDRQPTALELLAATAATAGGGLLGYGIGGPGGAAIGNAAPAAVTLAWRLGNHALATRLTRGSQALDQAAQQLGTDLDDIAQRAVTDPARLELLARVLEAAGRSPLPEKIPALGQVLAQGITAGADAAQVDEALLLATALDTIEAPHAQVLDVLSFGARSDTGAPPATRRGGMFPGVIAARLPGHARLLDSLLHALQGQGLVEDVGTPKVVTPAPRGGVKTEPAKPQWRLTDLGWSCIDLLRADA
ncbi:MAG: hypothetical protein JWP11_3424 [Frankiales bacterium]|nr:hypothetical protein [Frankiales bacterium]